MTSLYKKLPESDAFILRHRPFRVMKQTKSTAIGFHRGQQILDATFCTILASKQRQVFMVKQKYVSTLFNLEVGGEIISGDAIVRQIINAGKWKDHSVKDLDIYEKQCSALDSKHDRLSMLLLLCIGFISEDLHPATKQTERPALDQPVLDQEKNTGQIF